MASVEELTSVDPPLGRFVCFTLALVLLAWIFQLAYSYIFEERLTYDEEVVARNVVEAVRDASIDVGKLDFGKDGGDAPPIVRAEKFLVTQLCIYGVVEAIGIVPWSPAAELVVQREARKWMVHRKMRPTDIAMVLPHVPGLYFVRTREMIEAGKIRASVAYRVNQNKAPYRPWLPGWWANNHQPMRAVP
jgi:hypothetical protein